MKKGISVLAIVLVFGLMGSLSALFAGDANDTTANEGQGTKVSQEQMEIELLKNKLENHKAEEKSKLQLAKEQLRGDFYKDSQDSLKSALYTLFTITIAVILSAFSVIAYFIFKDKKDYKDALADAKEAARDAKDAAKNAHDLEKEARDVLADIKKQTTATLEEINAKAKETLDAIKAGREEIEETSKEQRSLSDMRNKALKADLDDDFAASAKLWEEITVEDPNDNWAFNNWGNTLDDLSDKEADKVKREPLLKQACEKYESAIKIKPNFYEAFSNWGISLRKLSDIEGDEVKKESLLNESIDKYESAIKIKPDCYEAFNNWGIALNKLAAMKKGKEREAVLDEAIGLLEKCGGIKRGAGAYNMACAYAQKGDVENCRKWLNIGEEEGILVTREEAMKDEDLKIVRDKAWFKKIKWLGEG